MNADLAGRRSLSIDEAFALGDRILTERGWDKNAQGYWVRPSDNRPARLSATPDHKGSDINQCVQLQIRFAAFTGEGHAPADEVIWTRP
jgi:hypothetical protein